MCTAPVTLSCLMHIMQVNGKEHKPQRDAASEDALAQLEQALEVRSSLQVARCCLRAHPLISQHATMPHDLLTQAAKGQADVQVPAASLRLLLRQAQEARLCLSTSIIGTCRAAAGEAERMLQPVARRHRWPGSSW